MLPLNTATIVLSDSSSTEEEVEENQDDKKVGDQKKGKVVWTNNDTDTFLCSLLGMMGGMN